MTDARSRLLLGTTAVGTVTLAATAMLISQAHVGALQLSGGTGMQEFLLVLGAMGIWAAVLLPFDFVGGYLLPRRFQRVAPSLAGFTLGWTRGVLVQSLLIAAFLGSILQAAQVGGLMAVIGAVTVAQVGLVAGQKHVAAMVARLGVRKAESIRSSTENRTIVAATHSDSGFTGSIVGLPGLEQVIVPRAWLDRLEVNQLHTELTRRCGVIQSGSRTRGIILAIAVNTLTLATCTQLPTAGVSTVSELITTSLYFTLVSFAWLLVLPRWSREGVFEADRLAFEAGVPVNVLEATAESIESLHDDEPKRSRRLESIFHPVPCVNRRVAELSLRIRSIRGFWNVARMTLFLSWSCGGFLSRAVHCNIGRPELWVMLPVD